MDRRKFLAGAGSALAGTALFSGSASAHIKGDGHHLIRNGVFKHDDWEDHRPLEQDPAKKEKEKEVDDGPAGSEADNGPAGSEADNGPAGQNLSEKEKEVLGSQINEGINDFYESIKVPSKWEAEQAAERGVDKKTETSSTQSSSKEINWSLKIRECLGAWTDYIVNMAEMRRKQRNEFSELTTEDARLKVLGRHFKNRNDARREAAAKILHKCNAVDSISGSQSIENEVTEETTKEIKENEDKTLDELE